MTVLRQRGALPLSGEPQNPRGADLARPLNLGALGQFGRPATRSFIDRAAVRQFFEITARTDPRYDFAPVASVDESIRQSLATVASRASEVLPNVLRAAQISTSERR
jgi:hypothetical protein